MPDSDVYRLYAVKYATHDRTQELNFVDPPVSGGPEGIAVRLDEAPGKL
jgi:hypothetical protein|tara:strand:- start:6465 stop:6611 length:147 start_codon:yes stop_codon:yes gene_type:complete